MNHDTLNLSVPLALDLLRTRRSGSAKAMQGPGPTNDQIQTLVNCAARVPDHGKLAPWRFIIFTGDARAKFGEVLVQSLKSTEADVSAERQSQERNRLLRAPTVIAVISRVRADVPIPEWEQTLSAGASCQTLCIAAHAMGFVANWITEWYAYHSAVAKAMGLVEGERVAGFVYIGHPKEPLIERPRPSFESIATYYAST